MKLLTLAATVTLALCSVSAFALTCPSPSDIQYQNGQWVLPQGWQFDQYVEGTANDHVDKLVEVEWQAIIKGGHMGNVDYCKYTWKNKNLGELRVSWWGDPLFVQPANMTYWTNLGGGKAFRCHSTIQNCSFIPGTYN